MTEPRRTRRYPLLRNGPVILELQRDRAMQEFLLREDGDIILEERERQPERTEYSVTLRNGEELTLLIDDGESARVTLRYRGFPVPGSYGDPMNMVSIAVAILYLAAVARVGMGLFVWGLEPPANTPYLLGMFPVMLLVFGLGHAVAAWRISRCSGAWHVAGLIWFAADITYQHCAISEFGPDAFAGPSPIRASLPFLLGVLGTLHLSLRASSARRRVASSSAPGTAATSAG